MSMREWSSRRRVLTVLAGILSLLVVAAVAVPLLVPAERWKELALDQLQKHTQLVASAESASVSLFPLGLKLEGLRVEDPQGITQLESFEFELQRAVVRASLASVLRGAPRVQEVRLVRPVLAIGLSESREEIDSAAPSEGTPPAPDIAVVLSMLSIEDGRVVVVDPAGTRIELDGLQNRANLRSAAGMLSGNMRGELVRTVVSADSLPTPLELPRVHWQLKLAMPLDGAGGAVTIESIEVAGARADGAVAWQIGEERTPALDLDLDVHIDLARAWNEFLREQVATQPLPAPWTVDDFALTGGEVTLDVTMQGPVPAADPQDPMAALRPFRISGHARDATARILDRSDLARMQAKFSILDAELLVEEARLDGALGTVQAAMRVGLALTDPLRGNATADLDLAALRALGEQWWPKLGALAGEEAAGPQQWPSVQGRVQMEVDFAVAMDGSFDPLTAASDAITWTARGERIVARMPAIEADFVVTGARLRGDLAQAVIEQVQLEGPGLQATATLELGGWPEATVVRGNVDASKIDLDLLQKAMAVPAETASLAPNLHGPWSGVRVAHAQEKTGAELPPPPPAELDVDVRVQAREVHTTGYVLRDVGGQARLVEQQLRVTEIGGKLGTGSIGGEAGLDWTADPPAWTTDLRANEVPASALLEPVAGSLANALSTSFSGDLQLDGPVALDPVQIVAALTGAVSLNSSRGTFAAESLLGPTVSQFLGRAADRWRAIDFSALTANVSVSGGRVHFDRVFLTGDTEMQATGSVGLDGTPAYRLDVRLPRGVTPELGALQPVADLLRDDQGRIAFGVNVSGEAKRPKVEIDVDELRRRAEREGGERVRSELRDRLGAGDSQEARDKLGDALGSELDGLFGGTGNKSAAADSAAADSAAVDPRQQLEEKAKDAAGSLLDRLKGRKKGGGGGD
jgi:hypothetical protein